MENRNYLKNFPKVINLGCRLNFFESEIIKDILDSKKINNTIVVNTCAVTNSAVSKSINEIKKASKKFPNSKIIVTGCASQIDKTVFSNLPNVSKVVDNKVKTESNSYISNKKDKIGKYKFPNFNNLVSARTRATLQIQQGCDHRCTFCVIPFGRGDAVSLPVAEVNKRLKNIISLGYKEVTFTGVDLTSYGNDIPGKPNLGNLLKRVLIDNPELKRLRLSSIDPAEIDDELMNLMCYEKRLLPHFHFSIQSGDNLILKRMKRRHNRDDVIRICQKIKKERKEVTFGADLIVGFPTENEAHFNNTLELVKICSLSNVHIFPYSPKENTPASKMPQVDENRKKERVSKLRSISKEILQKLMQEKNGRKIKVLFESTNLSYTDDFFKVKIKNNTNKELNKGEIIEVKILNNNENFLKAIV